MLYTLVVNVGVVAGSLVVKPFTCRAKDQGLIPHMGATGVDLTRSLYVASRAWSC